MGKTAAGSRWRAWLRPGTGSGRGCTSVLFLSAKMQCRGMLARTGAAKLTRLEHPFTSVYQGKAKGEAGKESDDRMQRKGRCQVER